LLMALKIPCHVVNTLPQTAFSAIFPLGVYMEVELELNLF